MNPENLDDYTGKAVEGAPDGAGGPDEEAHAGAGEAVEDVPDGAGQPDVTALTAEMDLLLEENRRLRRQYERARRAQYRRTALGLVLLGLLGIGGAVVFPDSRTVLLALGGTGVFAGLLTVFLTPEQFIPARVGELVYAALATNEAAIVADLGLADPRVYVPTDDPDDPVVLFVPQHEHYAVPDGDDLGDVFVVTGEERTRGLSLEPTGRALFDEYERALGGPSSDDPVSLAGHLADALVEQFELADSARVDAEMDDGDGRVTVAVSGSAYGAVDRFDHPVASLFAVGIVDALDEPVTVEVAPGENRVEYTVTCRWPVEVPVDDGR